MVEIWLLPVVLAVTFAKRTRSLILLSPSPLLLDTVSTALLDERRLAVLIRQHDIGEPKDGEVPAILLAFLFRAEESKLGRILVETAILLSMHNRTDAARILRNAAHAYKVDLDAHLRDHQAVLRGEGQGQDREEGPAQAAPS